MLLNRSAMSTAKSVYVRWAVWCLGGLVVGCLGGWVSSTSPFFDCKPEIFHIFGSSGHDVMNR